MALKTKEQKETVQVVFGEVSNTGVFIAKIEANHKDSMSILRQNGLRPLTCSEALVKIDQSPKLKEQLKGLWFYLDGKGSALSEFCTFNDKGELRQGKGDIEKTVWVFYGDLPLKLYVPYIDNDARIIGRRFDLYANTYPNLVARVVVGVRPDHEMATPKIEVAQTGKPGEITLSGTSLDTFKTLLRGAEQELSKLTEALDSENMPYTRMLVEALRIKE